MEIGQRNDQPVEPTFFLRRFSRAVNLARKRNENISTVEVESVIYRHPDVQEVAVIPVPDDKWGETPCAFVTLKDCTKELSEEEVISFCRDNMARFKVPKTVVFSDLPKTSTGKIQKFQLREQALQLA